jgi:hypothetical protein
VRPSSGTQVVAATSAELSPVVSHDGFREQRRRKRSNTSDDELATHKKVNPQASTLPAKKQAEVAIKNYYAPLRTVEMDAEDVGDSPAPEEEQQQKTTGRPPPIVMTSATNLINLQNSLKGVVKGNYEFRSTRNGTRVVTREMADYCAIRAYFDTQKLNYFTFYAKSEKPIKAVIRHLPIDTPAEDISNGLVELGFDILSVKQMTTTRPSESGRKEINLPLFLITLRRNEKSQTIFKLNGLCHIAIRVEAYKAQNNITQCYNCQKFGHIWANCRQPPRCMWCGGGHLHKECPEAEKETSTPNCCNCSLKEGE